MWLSIGFCAMIVLVLGLFFKEIVFFSFDEPVSRVFGVRTGLIYYLMLVLLSLTVVLSIHLVGFVLVSALLVLPAASALQISNQLIRVLVWSVIVGLVGSIAGLLISLQAGALSPGPCIVLVLCVLFSLLSATRHIKRKLCFRV